MNNKVYTSKFEQSFKDFDIYYKDMEIICDG